MNRMAFRIGGYAKATKKPQGVTSTYYGRKDSNLNSDIYFCKLY